jgi:hypothetical protein
MRIFSIVLLSAALAISGCKPDLKGDLGTPSNKMEGMAGTWELNKFGQQDLNNPIKEVRDLSDFYINGTDTPYRITFAVADMSYSVAPGPGRNYFGTSGTWGFDNPDFPSFLRLFSATDTLEFDLGSMVRPFDNALNLELPRPCNDADGFTTNTVIYQFQFNRVQ